MLQIQSDFADTNPTEDMDDIIAPDDTDPNDARVVEAGSSQTDEEHDDGKI